MSGLVPFRPGFTEHGSGADGVAPSASLDLGGCSRAGHCTSEVMRDPWSGTSKTTAELNAGPDRHFAPFYCPFPRWNRLVPPRHQGSLKPEAGELACGMS